MSDVACPVCTQGLKQPPVERIEATEFTCISCDTFRVTRSAAPGLQRALEPDAMLRATLRWKLRQMQGRGQVPTIDSALVSKLDSLGPLPRPLEQAENLLLWLGENSSPGERPQLMSQLHGVSVGAVGDENFAWLVEAMIAQGWLDGSLNSMGARVRLTLQGWERYHLLKKGHVERRVAFMAMEYGDATLDEVFLKCFKPAVEATGFRLERLDERPRAGLIDDRLRVEIRTSRFLVADLTHGNQGAYWEAGFAEGLGKPVIYTCERTVFEQKKTHFDTNHHLTLPWDKAALPDAAERLKATIRATLPDEVKLSDE